MSDLPSARFLDRTTPPHIVTLIFIAAISAMTMNFFLPSLPRMADHFGTTYAIIQLSLPLYMATSAVLQLMIGPISDKYGRRSVMLWSLAIYMLATIGCIFSPSVTVFLTFRMLQAVATGGMVLSRAVVRDMVGQDKAASLLGYVTMGMALIPMIGPAIGGILDEVFGWQANFIALLLAGLGLFLLVWADQGETARRSGNTLLKQFREYPEVTGSRRFWGYALAAAFSSGVFFAYLGGAPFVGTEIFGLSSSIMGLYFGIVAFGYMVGNFISGRFSVRLGINRMILLGTYVVIAAIVAAIGMALLGATHPMSFFGFMFFLGLGNGMVLPNSNAGLLSVRPHLAGTASGLGGAIMVGGGSALSALAGFTLHPGVGLLPLLWIMIGSAIASLLAVLYVLHVTRIAGDLPDHETI